jgi:hypothetical protein
MNYSRYTALFLVFSMGVVKVFRIHKTHACINHVEQYMLQTRRLVYELHDVWVINVQNII